MAGGSYTRSPVLEDSTFAGSQRSCNSRIIYESDCSSPTSWEFWTVEIGNTKKKVHLEESEIVHLSSPLSSSTPMSISVGNSYRRISSGSENTHSKIKIDGSRNSTGSSSSESQRSHDSGFLDSIIETRRLKSRQSHHSTSQNSQNSTKSSYNGPTLSLSNQTECAVSVNNNGGLKTSRESSNEKNRDSISGEIYQEVIVSRWRAGQVSPLLENNGCHGELGLVELFGTPASASTPKKSLSNLKRMEKIDNFETLNKNMKSWEKNKKKSCSRNENLEKSINSLRSIGQPRGLSSLPTSRHKDNGNSISPETSFLKKSTISPKFQSLPPGFKRLSVNNSSNTSQDIIFKSHFDNDAMRLWLHELRCEAEPDPMYSLQEKSVEPILNKLQNSHGYQKSTNSVSTPLVSIRNIQAVADFVIQKYAFISTHLEICSLDSIPGLILDFLIYIEDFLTELQAFHGKLERLESILAQACYRLRLSLIIITDRSNESDFCRAFQNFELNLESPNGSMDNGLNDSYFQSKYLQKKNSKSDGSSRKNELMASTLDDLVKVRSLFGQIIDEGLTRELYTVLDLIGGSGFSMRISLQVFSQILYDGGMHICKLAAGIRTVRTLLSATLDSRDEFDRILCLRCLSTLLCVGEAVNDFDKAGGFEIIGDILWDPAAGLDLKYEAIAVLTQATDPWIDLETRLSCLGTHLQKIILALTNLIPYCEADDNFLLTMAAISNLTFLELSSIEFLRSYKAISLITATLHSKPHSSIFVLDHVSTILANMAGIESSRQDIVQNNGVELLLLFLQMSPLSLTSQAEITACERVQQKSTIAISRLVNEDGVAHCVLRMGGIQRLVQLSRTDVERNYSDGVLIACLATLRKLVSICGSEIIKELHAEELIQPRLLDSFLLFSSRQESYV